MPKRILEGVVTSDKGNKTITVEVSRRVKHPVYKKVVVKSKKFYAHDEENRSKTGDKVTIQETAPISKLKRWVVVYGDEAAAPKKAEANAKKPAAKAKGTKAKS